MLSRMYRMAFWVMWDHLGKLVAASALFAIVVMLPGSVALSALVSGDAGVMFFVGVPLSVLACGLLAPVLGVGLAAMATELIETRDGSLRTFFSGMRQHGLRAAGVGTVSLFLVACLLVSAWFYATRLGGAWPWIGYGLSALALWTLVFLCLCLPFLLPALVQKKAPVLGTLKLAAALVLDNLMVAMALATTWLVLLAASIVPPLLLLVTPAAAVVTSVSAYELLARKYAAAEGAIDAEDDYLNRGLRDLLFPWKN